MAPLAGVWVCEAQMRGSDRCSGLDFTSNGEGRDEGNEK
jgi:hypothetical protein